MNRNKIESKLWIEDIVKSKGYTIYKNWKRKQKSLNELVDSVNHKINQDNELEVIEIKKEPIEPFKQLAFEF